MSEPEEYYDALGRPTEKSVLEGSWFVTGPDGQPIDEGGQSRVFLKTQDEALVRAHSCAKHTPDTTFYICQQRAAIYGVVEVRVAREDFQ